MPEPTNVKTSEPRASAHTADREFGATPMPVNDRGDHSSYDHSSYWDNDGVSPVTPDGTNPLVIG
ncbi:hypothetical protein [Streptomyces decoyicus]|uniref:hypothetical protein n=1 Tax=Streptomyces decoyicus TaxID=249567 RepID=UPI00364EE50C